MNKTYDFAVVGSGVFGAWTAHYLRNSGARVALLDGYGPANSHASSGGETRVIRMGYGPDELYTRWALRSLPVWQELQSRTGTQVFHPTGVLWLAAEDDAYTKEMCQILRRQGVSCEKLDAGAVRQRCPQLRFPDVTWALLEPQSGLLMARRSVQLLVRELQNSGVDCIQAAAAAPPGKGRATEIRTNAGGKISAGTFVFACGPWLPKLFPEIVGDKIFPSRQEVFFLGTPAGTASFGPPEMPVWLHHQHPDIPYALPDMEGRGFKIAFDRHGPSIDPDSDQRIVSAQSLEHLREFLGRHIPALQDAPVVETRVCQYENTWNGDFLIDCHPELENVWLAGGGSGHGFKHGPAVGEYLSGRILHGQPAEPRFALASKQNVQARAVF